MKEILEISVDEELGMTDVSIRVPQFENFGKRLGELEKQASEALQAEPEPEADPELEAEIEEDLKSLTDDVKAGMESMKKGVEDMQEGTQKAAMMQLFSAIENMNNDDSDDDDDGEAEESGANGEDRFVYDLQLLRVSLTEMEWNAEAEAKVDRFLEQWPSIRPAVLQATFKFYKELHPELVEIFGDSSWNRFTLPKPESPEIVADLFKISTLYLREDGCIGLGGCCTWDDEHGYGVLLQNGKVVAVGHESDAFA